MGNQTFYGDGFTSEALQYDSFPLSLNRFKNIEEKKNTGLSYPHP